MSQNKTLGDTITLDQYFIPQDSQKLPQTISSYSTVEDKVEFNRMFKDCEEIIIRLDGNTGFFRHKIHKRIVTYNKDGCISPSRSQTIETYKEYKQWLVDRFNKKQVYKLKV